MKTSIEKQEILEKEAQELYYRLVDLRGSVKSYTSYHLRISKLALRAFDRWDRRDFNFNGVIVQMNIKAGRPFKKDKKIPIGVKLPPYLNDWMKRQPESKAELIETALVSYYQISEELNK